MASHCVQRSNDFGSAGQILHGVSENVCTEENCSSLSREVDTSIMKPEIKGDGTSEVGLDSANQNNDFEVVKQTLADICDQIGAIDGSSTNSSGINGEQGDSSLPVATKDMMSSAKFGRTDNMVVECVMTNDDLHGNLNIINVESSGNEQCSNDIEVEHSQNDNQNILVEKDNKPEIGSDCCHSNVEQHKNTEVLENCNSNNNTETTVEKDMGDEFQYRCCQHLVVNNQSPNEQSAPDEQNAKIKQTDQRQPSVTNKPSQIDTIPDDLLHVLSVVQEDMRDMVLSTSTTKDRQLLTNGQAKETTSTDESDSSESSSDESSDDSDSESEEDGHVARSHMAKQEKSYSAGPHQTRGELSFSDLPHVDALDLCVDESVEIIPLGEVESILSEDALVIIKSFEGVPAVDADSILFLENRLGFGKVFDIFGQVLSPHYCVRFNNEDEIKSTDIDIGQTVYFAPDTKDLTNFVFVSQLKSIRGTDASWEHDREPPASLVEYSDDEAESHAKAERKRTYQLKKRNQAHMQGTTEGVTSSKKERPYKPHREKPKTKPTPRQLLMLSANQQSRSLVNAPQMQRGQQLACPAPPQGGGFFLPRPQGQGVPPDIKPLLRIPPPPSNPRGLPSLLDGQHQLFPTTLMGPPLNQPNLPCPPRFHGPPLNGPTLRNFIMPQGPPQPYFGPPQTHFGPPIQGVPYFRPPFQTFPQPPPPCQQNWNGPPHNGAGPQPWMARNVPPNGSPMNEHHWPIGQLHTMVQEPPPSSYIKQEFPQNVGMGPQNVGSQPWMSGGHGFPSGPPMNTQHVPRLPYIKQEAPPDVQKYLNM